MAPTVNLPIIICGLPATKSSLSLARLIASAFQQNSSAPIAIGETVCNPKMQKKAIF